ncbi:MAG: VTT domain-containing protein, partial [Bacteroidales bacterium]|nr:VTT domain-containing protein [Bacteroidales bacterium]
IILILVTTCIAILIVSSTLGRELYEGRGQNLASFGLVHFSGYLFFLLMPVELAYIYYLGFFSEWEMIVVALTTATAAQIIDYYIGLSMSTAIVNNLVGEKRILNAEKHILKYGNLTILIFNLFPLSSSIIAVSAGILKYPFKGFIIYSTAGLIIKYIVLTLLF